MNLWSYFPGYGSSLALLPSLEFLVEQIHSILWRPIGKYDYVEVSAGVFAVWTILSSKDMFKDTNDRSCLIKPHIVQIVAIFCLLGLDSVETFQPTRNGHLIEMETSEGKSILLGGLSCLWAIFGYKVSCASYSAYLSKQDYYAFKELFELFEVNQNI
eukprot:gene5336-10674_t